MPPLAALAPPFRRTFLPILLALIALAAPSAAAVFNVNSTGDQGDASPGNGACDDGEGNCTLRGAIQEANAW